MIGTSVMKQLRFSYYHIVKIRQAGFRTLQLAYHYKLSSFRNLHCFSKCLDWYHPFNTYATFSKNSHFLHYARVFCLLFFLFPLTYNNRSTVSLQCLPVKPDQRGLLRELTDWLHLPENQQSLASSKYLNYLGSHEVYFVS